MSEGYFSIEGRRRSEWLAAEVTRAAIQQIRDQKMAKLEEMAALHLAGKPDKAAVMAGEAAGLGQAVEVLMFKVEETKKREPAGRLDPGAPRSTRRKGP